jgi:nucleoside-diphosphate-sugar epimerase
MSALSSYPSVLVTGGTGWLGRRLVKALTTGLADLGERGVGGLKVRCLVQPGEPTKELLSMGADVCVGSVTDKESLKHFLRDSEGALLFHTAGVIHPRLFVRDIYRVNVGGTQALFDASGKAKVRRAVVMSSNSPFGGNPTPEHLFDETSDYNPYMGYGKSKRLMELDLKARMGRAGAPEITIVRAPWFYGPGQPPRQTLFFRMIRDGKFPLLGNGMNRRSMGYVDSLALGMLLAASKPEAANNIYWLADERPYAMHEIISTVRDVLHQDFGMEVKPTTLQLPSVVGDIARLIDGSLQSCGLYHQKFHVLSEMNMTIACSIKKAERELGYKPLVALREGMRRSVEWCLANNQVI